MERNKKYDDDKIKKSIKDKYDWLELYVKNSIHRLNEMKNIDITDSEVMRKIELQELEMIRKLTQK